MPKKKCSVGCYSSHKYVTKIEILFKDENKNNNLQFSEIIFEFFFPTFRPKRKW